MQDSVPYPGETSKTAEKRFVGHLNTVLQECHSATNTPVGQHFRSAGHSHTDIQGRSKVRSGLQEGKEGLWPSLIDLIDLSYQVGAKFGVAYQEGLWILSNILFTREEKSFGVAYKEARKVCGPYLPWST